LRGEFPGRPGGRLLGVDWGATRIGLAISDPAQTIAQPLTTLTRRAGKRIPVKQLLDLVRDHAVTGVIVGLPLDENGTEGEAARGARGLAAAVAERGGLPVSLWDERFSTARARRAVQEMGGSTRGRKADLDALAAAVLLQHYLDAKRGTAL
jgi:putative Holliday junction resolvase